MENDVKYVSTESTSFNKRYVVIDGKLFKLPSKLTDLFQYRKPFKPFVSYLFKDWRTASLQLQPNEDISVDAFFRYRFGPEIADYLVNALCIGITGGDSKALSMKSMFPNVFKKEQTLGSVAKGMFVGQDIRGDLANHQLVKKSVEEKWTVFSFDGGIQTLSNKLSDHLEQNYPSIVELMPNTEIMEIAFGQNEVSVSVEQKNINSTLNLQVDHVFSSLPAFKLASVLCPGHEKLKSSLQSIPTVHMALVSLQFDLNVLPDQFTGFGILVPSSENSPILGMTFDSCIFPSDQHEGTKITVCFISILSIIF